MFQEEAEVAGIEWVGEMSGRQGAGGVSRRSLGGACETLLVLTRGRREPGTDPGIGRGRS